MDEFALISRYFDRQQAMPGVRQGIGDDGAVLQPGADVEQIQVIDTLVSGVHFPPATDPSDIAYRAVVVNLSDIAAMGGRPRWMTLALTIESARDEWLASFAKGLFEAADEYAVALVGGDTTRGDQLVVTLSISGEVARDQAVTRRGARPGDSIFVTGTFGDAAAGLRILQSGNDDSYLCRRFLRPSARIETGAALAGLATAMIDVSDGLAGDLSKLLNASDVGADVKLECVPISDNLRQSFGAKEQRAMALSGGDDYELCFTAAADLVEHIPGITAIGTVTATPGLRFLLNGNVVQVASSGYRHFQ